ncbi:flagellar hook-basal body complex protein FliE [Silvibacterium bohemicum]|uniref:Flagellar hook-basal body complex protein FliE n=1 Tax=Silvibacterium bohemicum TaxID=1577686 RepID=A0A841K2Y8_9BACT|nr:flagellar hook-basal body complex protein FliE [Silvibacterium bohemicum]MBB6144998.1 flagellar hook-basal body complex protein FliE [Silvibacterium bohemicum]
MSVSLGGIPSSYLPDMSSMDGGSDAGGVNFGDVLKNAVNSVNQVNDDAATQANNLLQGNGDVNSVMIAVEKADVSFQLMMQVRNKIVNAYQDIEKMQF